MRIDRRSFLGAAAGAAAWPGLPAVALPTEGAKEGAQAAAPKYTLSCNLELMFPKDMTHVRRMEIVAEQGLKAYSFWGYGGKDLDAIEKAASRLGLSCGSISGTSKTGWGPGLTKTGAEAAFLADIEDHAKVAQRLGCPNLISFVGAVQKDVPWETQYRQIVDGLRRAGDVAERYDVFVVLEPLNPVESPQMSVLSAKEGYKIVAEANHPRVKLDFDLYHLQLGEGNLINNLRLGLKQGWIRFVEIGDVPGRKEPGTGEVNYGNIFAALRETGYAGHVGMEHRSSSTPEHAIRVVKQVAGAN